LLAAAPQRCAIACFSLIASGCWNGSVQSLQACNRLFLANQQEAAVQRLYPSTCLIRDISTAPQFGKAACFTFSLGPCHMLLLAGCDLTPRLTGGNARVWCNLCVSLKDGLEDGAAASEVVWREGVDACSPSSFKLYCMLHTHLQLGFEHNTTSMFCAIAVLSSPRMPQLCCSSVLAA
jgi:hypothetical protein